VLRGLLEEILATEAVTYEPAVLPLVVRAGAGSVRDSLSVLDQLLAGAGPEGLTYERTVALLGHTDDSLPDEMGDALAAGGRGGRVRQGGPGGAGWSRPAPVRRGPAGPAARPDHPRRSTRCRADRPARRTGRPAGENGRPGGTLWPGRPRPVRRDPQ